jgi:putative DNA primase/helicase
MTDRPQIRTHDLTVATQAGWDALLAANVETDASDFVFRHGDRPCRFERDDAGNLVPVVLNPDRMRHRLSLVAEWFGQGAQPHPLPGAPVTVVKNVLATPDPPLPVVTRLVEVPVLDGRGRVHDRPGYSETHRVFYQPADALKVPRVPGRPTKRDVRRARELLADQLFGDFPFAGEAERAHAVCMVLQPFVRDLISGPTPLYLVEAPTPGTGKGLLVKAACWPALGREVAPMAEAGNEDEWRKRITSTLRRSPVAILIDNLQDRLDSAALAAALTTTHWEDRILGLSENCTLPNRALWAATGNNPALSGEMTRRSIRVRLDAKSEHPEDRTDFRHPDLMAWASANRGELVWAALTLGRAWVVAGRPGGSVRSLGGFESWAAVMSGILEVAGIPKFLGNLENLRAHAGSENHDMHDVLSRLLVHFGERPFKTNEIPDHLAPALGVTARASGWERRLGHQLAKHRDRVYGDLALRQGPYRGGSATWLVEDVGDGQVV